MKIGTQIKKYRNELQLSQEELAEKIYVSRQTISNWENDKNYPDIKSLLLLSTFFDVSLDILVKGDIEEMKKEIKTEDITKMKHYGNMFTILLIASILLPVPMAYYFRTPGVVIWLCVYAVTMYFAVRLEKQKKAHDIQTYKEIVAFYEGKTLNEVERHQEYGKRPYQSLFLALMTGFVALVVSVIMFVIIVLR